MPLTPRLASIIAAMIDAKLDAESRVENCPGCPYGGPAVGSRGNLSSSIAIVGEAPGETEIEKGQPFVGPAGSTLTRAIDEAGLGEADPFITNSIACRPDPVRPRIQAIDACRGRLMRDLEAHPRTVVVAVGGTALRSVTKQAGLRVLVARKEDPLLIGVWRVVPTVHPAWVRRGPKERQQWLVEDLTKARRLLERPTPRNW
jgi:uracil-DNA glycosylase family 4